MNAIPVIAIDGPTASGKGTIAQRVASALGWHVLDSGALYRLAALACLRAGVDSQDEQRVAQQAAGLDVRFDAGGIWMQGEDVSLNIREEAVGNLASRIAAQPLLREALLARQRDFRQAPGLVADGRDMGTIVFPDAPLKIFLDADVASRAQRRCKQLKEKGFSANISELISDMEARDARDRSRSHAPLRPADGAIVINSSRLSVEETVNAVLGHWSKTSARHSGLA